MLILPFHLSAPCKPRHIKAVMDCYLEAAQVSWYPSDGALSYVVVASAPSGHEVGCETNVTSCQLDGLLCGLSYSVSVRAVGDRCSSVADTTAHLVTGERALCVSVSVDFINTRR